MRLLDLSQFPGAVMTREALAKRAAHLCGREVDTADVGLCGRFAKASEVIEDRGGPQIEGTASTDDVDCDDEVVLAGGLDWSTMLKYRTLYVDHMYGVANACATLRYVKRYPSDSETARGWRIRAKMLPPEVCPEVPRILALAREDAMGLSIGFLALDRSGPTPEERKMYPRADSIVRRAMVFEVSLTSMPCNLSAKVDTIMVDDSKASAVLSLVAKGALPSIYGAAYRPKRSTVMI